MQSTKDHSARTPDFSGQIDMLRKLEPPRELAFLLQISLVLGGCLAAVFLSGWWVCGVWSVVYVGLQLCEKAAVRVLPDSPSLPQYICLLALLYLQASVFCFMPLYLWFLGPDVAKFGSLILITASAMHSTLHRAAYPSILLCFLVPDAAVFAVISISTWTMFGMSSEAALYLIAGFASCSFFAMTFFQAYLRDRNARREIRQRERAQAAQQASEVRFKSLFEGAPISIREEDMSGLKRCVDALNIPDAEAFAAYLDAHPEFIEACAREIVVLDVNRASMAQHGYTDKSKMLKNVLGTLSPAALKCVHKTLQAVHAGAPSETFNTQILRADGTIRWVVSTWSVIPGHEETYSRILLCSLDMAEHRKSEAALRHAQKMEVVGQLTGGVAHDFNNLLTVIGGNLDLMEDEARYDPELARPIRKAVDRGAELTQRLLAFSRKQPLNAKPIRMDTLVPDMRELLARTLGEDIVVTVKLEAGDVSAYADPGQVEAALLNLALNARDAMPGGGALMINCSQVTIAPRDNRELEGGEYVALSVTDTGSGMAPEILARAYEPFFTTKDVGKGTGLGLASVYGFAKQSGGDVHIESEVGKGTTVTLYLPRAEIPVQTAQAASALPQTVKGDGLRVLILEDDPNINNFLAKLISSNGFEVLTARDSAQAGDIVRGGPTIDLLISDVMLSGGMRGPTFASELLQTSSDTGVVFISGRPSEANLSAYPNLSGATVLQKPFTRAELMETITQALNAKRGEA